MAVDETNSYVTLAEAKTHLTAVAGLPQYAEWEAATDDTRNAALIEAARSIDRLPLKGQPAVLTQPLAFPRYGQVEVPARVKQAQISEAAAILHSADDPRRDLQRAGVAAASVSGTSETYRPGATGAGMFSPEAETLLRPWIRRQANLVSRQPRQARPFSPFEP